MKTFDHHSGDYLAVGSARIYYEVTGNPEGPVLLFLHGGLCTMDTYDTVVPRFFDHYKIIGIDTRGHGKSTLGSDTLTYEQIEQDVEAVLEHLGIQTLSIIGFSDGGIVAYRLAGSRKRTIEHVITIGSDWSTEHAQEAFPLLQKVTADFWKEKRPEDIESYDHFNPEPDFERLVKAVVALWCDASSTGYPNEIVDSITCPVLAIRGAGDYLVAPSGIHELAQRLKTAMALEIPDAAHAVHREQPEAFLTACEAFLGK